MTEYDRKWQKITESDSTRWQKDNHNMKQTSYLVISPHEATSCRWNVPRCRWNVFFSPSPKHAQLENGSTFSPQGGGRPPRWAGVSLGGRDPLSSFPRCALQTESGTQYCTLRHSKSQIWHFFRGQNLALFGSKNLYLVINGQYWLMKFPAETDSYLNCFKINARWWFFHFDDQPPQVT